MYSSSNSKTETKINRFDAYIQHDIQMIQDTIIAAHHANMTTRFECIRCCNLSYMERVVDELARVFVDSDIILQEKCDDIDKTKIYYKLIVDWTVNMKKEEQSNHQNK